MRRSLARQVAVPPPQPLEGVDDCGVGRQTDLLLQPVLVDGGDERPLVRHLGFLLDDAGERHHLAHAAPPGTLAARSGWTLLSKRRRKVRTRVVDDLALRGCGGEAVGLREEVALEVGGVAGRGRRCSRGERMRARKTSRSPKPAARELVGVSSEGQPFDQGDAVGERSGRATSLRSTWAVDMGPAEQVLAGLQRGVAACSRRGRSGPAWRRPSTPSRSRI